MPWSFCLTSPRSSNRMRFTKAAIAAVEFNAWITSKPSCCDGAVGEQPTTKTLRLKKGVKFWPLAMILHISSHKSRIQHGNWWMRKKDQQRGERCWIFCQKQDPGEVNSFESCESGSVLPIISLPISSSTPSLSVADFYRTRDAFSPWPVTLPLYFFYHLSVLTRKLADSLQRMPSPQKLLWLKWLDSLIKPLIKYCSKSFSPASSCRVPEAPVTLFDDWRRLGLSTNSSSQQLSLTKVVTMA